VEIDDHLDQTQALLDPLEEKLEMFKAASIELQAEKQSYRNVSNQVDLIQELLGIPQLLDASIRNEMWDETLDLCTFCAQTFQAYDNMPDGEIPLLERLKTDVAIQRKHLEKTLFHKLTTDVNLPTCVRLVGYLRKLGYVEEDLFVIFLRERRGFFESAKQKWERMSGTIEDAADLLRTHVCDIVTQYRALFIELHPPVIEWLYSQLTWFFQRVQGKLDANVDAFTLCSIFRQASHASNTLKKQGGAFIPALMFTFETYMENYFCRLLSAALFKFQSELQRHDWNPRTSDFILGHINCSEVLRHRPLAVFCNEIIAAFNELRQCAFTKLRDSSITACGDTLRGAGKIINDCREVMELARHSDEFDRMCRSFGDLRSIVNVHLEAIYGPDSDVCESVLMGVC